MEIRVVPAPVLVGVGWVLLALAAWVAVEGFVALVRTRPAVAGRHG